MYSMMIIVNNLYCIFESSWESGPWKFSQEKKRFPQEKKMFATMYGERMLTGLIVVITL